LAGLQCERSADWSFFTLLRTHRRGEPILRCLVVKVPHHHNPRLICSLKKCLWSPQGYETSPTSPLLGSQHTTNPLKLATLLTDKSMAASNVVFHDAYLSTSEFDSNAWVIFTVTHTTVNTESLSSFVFVHGSCCGMLSTLPLHHGIGKFARTADLQAQGASEEVSCGQRASNGRRPVQQDRNKATSPPEEDQICCNWCCYAGLLWSRE